MVKAILGAALLAASIIAANPAAAQVTPVGPTTNRLNVTFTGIVTNDVTNSIRIRQPDGSLTPYAGPVPEYPYRQGDTVSIGFQTIVPNRNFYSSPSYNGQVAADGIYRIAVTSPATGVSSNPGYTGAVDISGPIATEGRPGAGPFAVRGITIVYNSINDTYSLELGSNGWTVAPLDAPTYTYDASTGALLSRNSACIGVQCESASLVLRGTDTSATIGGFNGIPIGTTAEPSIGGFMDAIGLSGLFNFSIFGGGSTGGGGPIDVPEPSMIFLFGGAAGVLMRRRRKAKV